MTRPNTVPTGWVQTTVGACGDVRLGRQKSPSNRANLYPTKYIRAANITWDGLDLTDVLEMDFSPDELPQYRLLAGDVLLAEASGSPNEVGKPVVWQGELEPCCFQNTVIRFRSAAVLPRFALIAFSHYARNGVFAAASKGVGIQHLSADRFAQLPFQVPPRGEQHRIVAKVEELLSDVDAGVRLLEQARVKLKQYRAAVLKAAVAGDLTADWRAAHPDAEPASALLERVLVERRRQWEEDQVARFKAAGRTPPTGWQAKYPVPALLEADGLPELPPGWCWTTLDSVADLVGGITKGQQRKSETAVREVPYLRVANVQRGYLDLSEMKTISSTEAEIAELRLQPGDVLFNEGGDRDKLGRGWVWRGELPEVIHQNHVFRGRLFSSGILPEWVSHHGNTFGQQWFQRAGKQSVNLASINLGVLRRFPVPLAPAAEQAVAIGEVEQRLSVIKASEDYVDASLKRAARLRQSVLAEAFTGRLVPQDPADEPASALLERVRQKKAAATNGDAPTRRRRRRSDESTSPTQEADDGVA